jgi:hypothetical protein
MPSTTFPGPIVLRQSRYLCLRDNAPEGSPARNVLDLAVADKDGDFSFLCTDNQFQSLIEVAKHCPKPVMADLLNAKDRALKNKT